MKSIIIKDYNNLLKPPSTWDDEKLGRCVDLHVRAVVLKDDVPSLTSAWLPSPRELAALNAGAPILLEVLALQHPPVMLSVGTKDDIGTKGMGPELGKLIDHITKNPANEDGNA
jgi:hypothetical protein